MAMAMAFDCYQFPCCRLSLVAAVIFIVSAIICHAQTTSEGVTVTSNNNNYNYNNSPENSVSTTTVSAVAVSVTPNLIVGEIGVAFRVPVPTPPAVTVSRNSTVTSAKSNKSSPIRSNKTATNHRGGGTRRPPQLLVALTNATQSSGTGGNSSRSVNHNHMANGNAATGGIGYGGEYADEWPIYVAILGLTVFAYVAWVLVYCLCQRRGTSPNYQSSLSTTSAATVDMAGQRNFNQMMNTANQTVRNGHLSTITNGSYYHSSNMSVQASMNPAGSPECSLEGTSLHEMIPPKYLQAMNGGVANFSFTVESANNTLLHCNDDFLDDNDETYVVIPRFGLNGSRVSSPPGYSDLTRISVVINAPSSDDDTTVNGGEEEANNSDSNNEERSPLVGRHHRHRHGSSLMARSVSNSGHLQPTATSPNSSRVRRNIARLHSNSSANSHHSNGASTHAEP